MATFSALKQRLEKNVDDTVDDEDALLWFNACSEDIAEVARYASTRTASFDKDLPTVALPSGWIEIVEVKIQLASWDYPIRMLPINLVQPIDLRDGNEWPFPDEMIGYELFGNEITIRPKQTENGTITMRMYGALPEIEDLEDSPVIPVMYHDLYPLYASMQYYKEYQDEIQTKRDYQGDYEAMKEKMNQYTLNLKNKTKSKTVYVTRAWR